MSAVQRLGEFVYETDELPPALVHETKRSILNFISAALAVSNEPALIQAVELLSRASPAPRACVIGHQQRLDVGGAAFANAMAGNWLDFDDTHLETVIHPSAPIFPISLARCEADTQSGAALLRAFALGAEIACRIGNAVSPEHYARGWHITTTCGVFGSAAACANLLGLDARQTAHALAIAASLSGGVVENLATAAKNVAVGNSARNGLLAAEFAQAGYEGAPTALEGKLGWGAAGGVEPNLERMFDGLGEQWEFSFNTYKPYPCGIVIHSVIDACLELRRQHDLGAADIDAVRVYGDRLLLARGDRVVADERDARVSIHHAVAVATLWGRAGFAEFLPAAVDDPEVVELRGKVLAILDTNLPPAAARVVMLLRDGRALETTVLEATGSTAHPMSDHALVDKLVTLCDMGGSRCCAASIAEQVWRLDAASSVTALTDTLRPVT